MNDEWWYRVMGAFREGPSERDKSLQCTDDLLLDDAARLLAVARAAEFRWWGDRVSLTLSIGAALIGQSCPGEDETLPQLLKRTQQAMQASHHAGGNLVTKAKGQECSQ